MRTRQGPPDRWNRDWNREASITQGARKQAQSHARRSTEHQTKIEAQIDAKNTYMDYWWNGRVVQSEPSGYDPNRRDTTRIVQLVIFVLYLYLYFLIFGELAGPGRMQPVWDWTELQALERILESSLF